MRATVRVRMCLRSPLSLSSRGCDRDCVCVCTAAAAAVVFFLKYPFRALFYLFSFSFLPLLLSMTVLSSCPFGFSVRRVSSPLYVLFPPPSFGGVLLFFFRPPSAPLSFSVCLFFFLFVSVSQETVEGRLHRATSPCQRYPACLIGTRLVITRDSAKRDPHPLSVLLAIAQLRYAPWWVPLPNNARCVCFLRRQRSCKAPSVYAG